MNTLSIISTIQQSISTYFFRLFQKRPQQFAHQSFIPNLQKPRLPKNYLTIVGIIILFIFAYYLGGMLNKTQTTIAGSTNTNVPGIKKQKIINKEFLFPLKNSKGEEITKLSYKIISAELQDTFIANGKTWRAVAGKQFLMLTLKISNSYSQGLLVNSRDYVRLIVPGEKEPFAPDFHNDGDHGMEVQAISTEPTRIGFAVKNDETKFTFQVGEIKGKKETITLDF